MAWICLAVVDASFLKPTHLQLTAAAREKSVYIARAGRFPAGILCTALVSLICPGRLLEQNTAIKMNNVRHLDHVQVRHLQENDNHRKRTRTYNVIVVPRFQRAYACEAKHSVAILGSCHAHAVRGCTSILIELHWCTLVKQNISG